MVEFYSNLMPSKTYTVHTDFVSFKLGSTKLGIGKHSRVKGKSFDSYRLMIHLEVDDIHYEYRRLLKDGVKFLRVPEKEHWGGFVATFEDIDDNINYFILATHHSNDDKIALEAIRKGIPYVGVIASQKKADLIKEYLSDNNVSGTELKNLYSPIGLDLKATTPEEIALSILSEIVMLENEATGKQMKHLSV